MASKMGYFLNSYLAAPRPTLGHYREDSFTNPTLITAFLQLWPEGHREPRSEVGSLSHGQAPSGIEQGAMPFLLQRLNPLGHSYHSARTIWAKNILLSFPQLYPLPRSLWPRVRHDQMPNGLRRRYAFIQLCRRRQLNIDDILKQVKRESIRYR